MKSSAQQSEELRRQRSEAIVETHVAAIFQRIPILAGFAVGRDLEVNNIAISTWPGYTAGQELYEDLMQALTDLAEDRPHAVELLRGRTFARAFH
jgi:hypothetical protein